MKKYDFFRSSKIIKTEPFEKGLRHGTSKKARTKESSFSVISRLKLARLLKEIECGLGDHYDEMKAKSTKISEWVKHPRNRDHFLV